jgi:pyruvate/2-oxoglutarate dehydrogenase complex dihydrolipoamide acyltransferase (E2) component
MATEVRLPKLGQTMEEGTIVNCTVKIGDEVRKGDILFEVETDKATLDIESPSDGFVKHILAEVGWTLFVGDPVLVLGGKDEEIGADFIESLKDKAAPMPVEPATTPTPAPTAPTSATEPAKSAGPPIAAQEIKLGATVPLNRLQKITAQKMLRSKREIPCFYLNVKSDVSKVRCHRAGWVAS